MDYYMKYDTTSCKKMKFSDIFSSRGSQKNSSDLVLPPIKRDDQEIEGNTFDPGVK